MFLVYEASNSNYKEITYIPDDDEKTIKDAVYEKLEISNHMEFTFHNNSIYLDFDIEDAFGEDENCLDEDGEFDWDKFNEALKNGDIDLDDVEEAGSVYVLDTECIQIDEDGDIC